MWSQSQSFPSRARQHARPASLALATLMILGGRVLFGVSAPVELAALGGVILAVFIARAWWRSRMPWTRPRLSNAFFTLVVIVALVPGAALQRSSFADGEQVSDRSIRDAAGAASVQEAAPAAPVQEVPAPAQPEVPVEVPVAPPVDPLVQEVVPDAGVPAGREVAPVEQPVVEATEPVVAPQDARQIEATAPSDGIAPVVTVEATTDPVPTPIAPGVALTVTGTCTLDGGYDVGLTMVTFSAPAVIAEVLVVPAPGAAAVPWVPQTTLPATVAPGLVNWQWTIDPATAAAGQLVPTGVFVRVANMPGDPVARAAIGSDLDGWVQAALPTLAEPCEAPPAAERAPVTEAVQDDTTTDVAESRSRRAAERDQETPEPEASNQAVRGQEAAKAVASNRAVRGREMDRETLDVSARAATVRGSIEGAALDPSTTPAPAAAPADPLRVTALSPDQIADPGSIATYSYRIENTGSETVTVRVSATNSVPGWTSSIYTADRERSVNEPVTIAAGSAFDVNVTVHVPESARPQTANATTLHADVADESTPAPNAAIAGESAPTPGATPVERSLRH